MRWRLAACQAGAARRHMGLCTLGALGTAISEHKPELAGAAPTNTRCYICESISKIKSKARDCIRTTPSKERGVVVGRGVKVTGNGTCNLGSWGSKSGSLGGFLAGVCVGVVFGGCYCYCDCGFCLVFCLFFCLLLVCFFLLFVLGFAVGYSLFAIPSSSSNSTSSYSDSELRPRPKSKTQSASVLSRPAVCT